MVSYHDLEASAYKAIRAKPFTQIHEKPDWYQLGNIIEEAGGFSMDYKVSYAWSAEYSLLAEMQGAPSYLTETQLIYVEPFQPPNQHV